MARTKQQNDMEQRDRRARKILQRLAKDEDIPFDRLLEEIEARGGVREYIEMMDDITLREASESPEVE